MNATEFLETWVRMSVDALRRHDHASPISDEVRNCQDAAFRAGLSESDLDAATDGDITAYLTKAQNNSSSAGSEIKEGTR